MSYFKFIQLLVLGLALLGASSVFAADRYRLSSQFYHLGELIAKPMIDVEEGETIAGTFSDEGRGQYKVVVLVRPVADEQVYVSMQFSSGKLNIQPNLLAGIGQPRSATIKKVRMNLLVEEIKEEDLEIPDLQFKALTQIDGKTFLE
ncbi:MAG: hypothetical protein OEU84_06970 [Xanthomonadales bacterium]|nr:hypothetical protein [Xanthomonadales bacterium]